MQVVEQDDRTRSQPFDDRADRRRGIGAEPRVPPVHAPADVEQPELASEQVVEVTGLRVRRTEEAWDGSDRVPDRALRPRELAPRGRRRQACEVRVAPRVIPELSDATRCPRARGPDPDAAADVEEGRATASAAEHADESERVGA